MLALVRPALLGAVLVGALAAVAPAAKARTLYVSPRGNDAWSGTLPEPHATASDGPLASLGGARDLIRRHKAAAGGLKRGVRVQIRAGTYRLDEPLSLEPQDSGSADGPISYEAFPGEQPVLSGGVIVGPWQEHQGPVRSAALPEVQAGRWYFRSLFAGGRRQIRARCPTFFPADPYRKGFLYADRDPSGFGLAVGNIHNAGDWMEYEVEIPADGWYAFWMYYGAHNAPFGRRDMDGRSAISVDGKGPVALVGLPDTGAWRTLKWSRAAGLALGKGAHRLRWQNLKGGGLTFAAFALADDPAWRPARLLPAAAPGKHLVVVQAANFVRHSARQLSVHGTVDGSKNRFCYAPGTFKPAWARAPGAEVHIFQSGSCRAFKEIVEILQVDPATRAVTVGGKECLAPLQPGDRYFVENVAEELDSPGEWHLDRQAGRLLFWPAAEADVADVVAPRAGRLLQLLGEANKPVAHVRLAGLTFQETDYSPEDGCAGYGMGNDGVVCLKNAEGCRIEDCVFRNIGKYAVCVTGGRRNTVQGIDVCEGAEGGVLILDSADNVVADNHIHHCGAVYKHVGGVVLQGRAAAGNAVAHNAIHDIARYGVSLKNPGGLNRIEFNRIQNTNLETYDTGAIEVTQHDRHFRSGSTIRNNIVADTIGYSSDGEKALFLSWGIYLDSFAGGYTVTDNVVYRTARGGMMFQGGKDNRVENNVFVDGKLNQVSINNFSDNSTGLVFRRNIVACSDPEAMLIRAGRLRDDVIQIDYNLYFPAGPEPLVRAAGVDSWSAWRQRGFDRHSLLADPRFADPSRDDYALRPDSPALRLGFRPIDTRHVGPRRRACACQIRPAAPDFGLD